MYAAFSLVFHFSAPFFWMIVISNACHKCRKGYVVCGKGGWENGRKSQVAQEMKFFRSTTINKCIEQVLVACVFFHFVPMLVHSFARIEHECIQRESSSDSAQLKCGVVTLQMHVMSRAKLRSSSSFFQLIALRVHTLIVFLIPIVSIETRRWAKKSQRERISPSFSKEKVNR